MYLSFFIRNAITSQELQDANISKQAAKKQIDQNFITYFEVYAVSVIQDSVNQRNQLFFMASQCSCGSLLKLRLNFFIVKNTNIYLLSE